MRQASDPNRKVGGSHHHQATIAPMGRSYLADQHCSVHGPLLHKTTNAFSPSAVYISPSSMMKAAKAEKYTPIVAE